MGGNPSESFSSDRADLSNFLIHLTKNGSYENYEKYLPKSGHYQFGNSLNLVADKSLKQILHATNGPKLEGRAPFGHFKFDINIYSKLRRSVPPDWLKCVCFSETPLRELRSFYRSTQNSTQYAYKLNRYQKFGLAFFTDFIRDRGGHPIFYFDSRKDDIYNAVDRLADPQFLTACKPLLPLFESFGPARKAKFPLAYEIDFRWEREWRHVGDLKFEFSDVAFGLCPEGRIPEFEKLCADKIMFVDPDWDTDVLIGHFKSKGRQDLASAL